MNKPPNMNPSHTNCIYGTEYSRSCELIGMPIAPSLKIVIRRLPPDMKMKQFLEQISPVPEQNYMYFVAADMQYGKNSFSRAYINFINERDLFIFKEKYDGYVFLSKKGVEYPAVVEYATSTRVPNTLFSAAHDQSCNTIESSYNYKKFASSVAHARKICMDKNVNLENKFMKQETENRSKTPLLMYLTQKKQEREKIEEGWKPNKNYRESGSCVFVNSNIRNNKRMY